MIDPTASSPREARALCERCRRPRVVCYCAELPLLPTRARILLLQHPRERRMGIGTARMAHLALPNSTLRVGTHFAADPIVAALLAEAAPAWLLFPGADAVDVHALAARGPKTLVVLDGTWSQARKLLRLNPGLSSLPRIAFARARPSDYRIRRQPADFCVSTIEALAEVLGVLEPEGGPFERLLDPFRAMVARQERFETEVHACRHTRRMRTRAPAPERPTLAMRLDADWDRLVCIQGEANAWSMRDPARQDPETIHFVAHRPATGLGYQAIIAPRRGLAPSTAAHTDLPAPRILDGMDREAWRRSWLQYARPDDVLVHWGRFHVDLAEQEGLPLAARRIDLRAELTLALGRRAGTLEAEAVRLPATSGEPLVDGRGGRRLATLVRLLRSLRPDLRKAE